MADRSKNPIQRALRGQEPIMTALVIVGTAAAGARFGFEVPADQILAALGIAAPISLAAARHQVKPMVDVKADASQPEGPALPSGPAPAPTSSLSDALH